MKSTLRSIHCIFPDEGERMLIVALDSGPTREVLGTVTVRVTTPKVGPKAAVFSALFVREVSRGEGIGRQLMEACEALAQKEGCAFITGYVKPGNEAAQAFYARCGYSWGYAWDDGVLAITKQLRIAA
jgi:GNAT superfamily N-acetyltransferase